MNFHTKILFGQSYQVKLHKRICNVTENTSGVIKNVKYCQKNVSNVTKITRKLPRMS